MPQYNGIIPDGLDLNQFSGIPDELIKEAERLSNEDPRRDKKLRVEFYQDSYFMSFESKEKGYPIFKTQDFISVWIDSKSDFHQLIKYDDAGQPYGNVRKWLSRFPKYYQKFKDGKIQGTPLSAVPGLDQGFIATLEASGVKTAESLAALEDTSGKLAELFPQFATAKRAAHNYINAQDVLLVKDGEIDELQKELERVRAELAQAVAQKQKGKNGNISKSQ